MRHLRSHAGVVAMTAGALAALAVPAIAAGKGPPEHVGSQTENGRGVVPPQANKPDVPPGQLKRRDAASPSETPAPAPTQAPTQDNSRAHVSPAERHAQAPAATPPALTRPQGTAPANDRGDALPTHHTGRGSHAHKSAGLESPGGEVSHADGSDNRTRSETPTKASAAAEPKPASAGTRRADGSDHGASSGVSQTEPMDLPRDASPATLPFTGLQLALMALVGLAVAAAGLTMRRAAAR